MASPTTPTSAHPSWLSLQKCQSDHLISDVCAATGTVEWVLAAACLASALCTVALPIETKGRGLTVRSLSSTAEPSAVSPCQSPVVPQHRRQCASACLQETLVEELPATQEPLLGLQAGPSDV